jgi:hypothetical protein
MARTAFRKIGPVMSGPRQLGGKRLTFGSGWEKERGVQFEEVALGPGTDPTGRCADAYLNAYAEGGGS